MNTLYPIIRRVRRALLPPDTESLGTALTVCGPSSPQPSPPGEGEARAVVEPSPVVAPIETLAESAPVAAVEPAPVAVVATADQSLLTSAATKATKGKREAAKSRVKAADEAHSTQP